MSTIDALIPKPQKVTAKNKTIKINGFCPKCDIDSLVVNTAISDLNQISGNYVVELSISNVLDGKKEAYILDICEDKTIVQANDESGVYFGVVTLLELYQDGILPICHIEDWPDFEDRGLMLENRYGSDFMTLDDYKDAIDYLSKMKYNQLTIGVYGCWCIQYDMRLSEFLYIPLKSHPELKTPRDIRYYSPKNGCFVEKEDQLPTIFVEDYLGDLIKYAQSRNIKIKPLFNSFGHNTLIPRLHPELSAKDENGNPTKHGFCVSNESVYEYMFSIYDEIIDRYLTPNGLDAIEIGLDEVYAWLGEDLDNIYGLFEPYCKCEKCRGMDQKELMLKYIIRVCKYLVSKGMKHIYIYHDMLFEKFDIVNEDLVNLFKKEGLYDYVVLDWWCYNKEEKLFDGREINGIFRSIAKPFTGYYHWVIPMEYNRNIYDLAVRAEKYDFEGIESYSSFEYCFDRPFMYQAQLSWNKATIPNYDEFLTSYAQNRFPNNPEAKEILDIMEDLTTNDTKPCLMNWGLEYYWYTYVAKDEPYPRNFHGSVYSKLDKERETYLPYLKSVVEKSTKAMNFFGSIDGEFAGVWYAIAMHYYTYANAYLSIIDVYDRYQRGEACPNCVIGVLNDLIQKQEEFMSCVEDTRIEANSYVYMRNHSITRQFYIDLLEYFEKEKAKGVRPEFKIDNFDYCLSERYKTLR